MDDNGRDPADDELPVDPDIEVGDAADSIERPAHLRWPAIGLVVAGGAIGTLARYALTLAIPAWNGVPVGVFVVNVSGAFLLGVLLEALARRGPDLGRRRDLRLFAGTGVLGGYTTYSTFAVDTDGLLQASHLDVSLLYALATVLVGAAASIAGIAVAAAMRRPRAGGA